MLTVPRHRFVETRYHPQAYDDHPLPIGYGQTISQPYIVALMSEEAAVLPGHRVLEVGTGSGYQAAIMAELTDQVYTIEIIEPLAQSAARRLRELGYHRVRMRTGDGYFGWPEAAPFDAILVTAAPDHIPPPLIRQLKEGGRMVVPVGPPGLVQTLWRITKVQEQVKFTNLGGVTFVPLVRR
jgi:protein-L-isoaspartate(D-aspartate) O-methyltransferase